jgi:hypothetical protein
MNSCLVTADSATQLKIVVVALSVGILVMLIGLSAHLTGRNVSVAPRIEMQNSNFPSVRPLSSGKRIIV